MSLNYKSIAVAGIGFGLIAVASQGFITPVIATNIITQTQSINGADIKYNTAYPVLKNKRIKQNNQDEEEILIQMMTSFLNSRPR